MLATCQKCNPGGRTPHISSMDLTATNFAWLHVCGKLLFYKIHL